MMMSQKMKVDMQHSGSDSKPGFEQQLIRLNQLLQLWINRYRQRKSLKSVEDHILKDIGVSRVDALQEASKPFWKA